MSYETEVRAVGLSFRHVTEQLKPGDKVQLVHDKDNEFDPNAVAIQTLDGAMLGYVGKKDPLRLKMLAKAKHAKVTLPVLVVKYYEEGDDALWKDVQPGDMVQLWLRALSLRPVDDTTFVEMTSFTGEKVLWSEYLHICTDMQGNELLGGSTYASQFEKPFDSERVAKAYAKKNGYEVEEVQAYWKSLGDTAADYGTSVHKAMEHYVKFNEIVGHDAAMPRVPHLKNAVEQFLKVSDFKGCLAEMLVTDTEKGMSGWIDNLRFDSWGGVTIEDYKTNTFKSGEYEKKWPQKLALYWKQLSYYAQILENHGYTVEGLVIWHWYQNAWVKHTAPFTSIKEYQR